VQQLVESIVEDMKKNFLSKIDTAVNAYEAIYEYVQFLHEQANLDPIRANFITAVALDVKVPLIEKKENYKEIIEISQSFINLAGKKKEFNPEVTAKEVALVLFTIPYRNIALSLDEDKNKKFTKEETKRITEIC